MRIPYHSNTWECVKGVACRHPTKCLIVAVVAHGRVEDPVNRLGGEGNTIIKHIPRESKTKRLNGLRDDPSKGFPTTHVQSLVFGLPVWHIYIYIQFYYDAKWYYMYKYLWFQSVNPAPWVQKHYLHPPSPHHVAKDVPKCHRQVFTALVLSWNKPGKLNQLTKE